MVMGFFPTFSVRDKVQRWFICRQRGRFQLGSQAGFAVSIHVALR
jgi:hypothetical protein